MYRRPSVVFPDFIALTVVAGALFSITVATLADNEAQQQRTQNAAQLRTIHQGMFTFANSNEEIFPDMDPVRRILENSGEKTGGSGHGDSTEARFWILIHGDYITPEDALAPADERATAYVTPDDESQVTPVTHENYSYAMLDITGEPGEVPIYRPGATREWRQSTNPMGIVMSDRNCADPTEDRAAPTSIWHNEEWHGNVLWSDGHVTYDETHIFETRYGNGKPNVDDDGNGTDNLFTEDAHSATDAMMTFSRDNDGNERAVPGVIEDDEE